ncbi:MAG TPA: YggS family pyridoxal phosphate-dependent enzyme [Candidatus Hydrogenedentes bacterium]|nr:YggS family pyridoxal phosphate-dependent enzyme [Candidatus Hydrogenedentota bacterium]HOL75771.1 YggS family pyridoxal phosphate-dependent enzyme [Candidatus Hydrogenedentota bacterium]
MQGAAFRICENLKQVRHRIDEAARRVGRNPDSVRLVAVTKSVGTEEIRILYDQGVREFGENRVKEASAKLALVALDGCVWHMIGTIQSRKARQVAQLFDCVDSLDRLELAQELNKQCERHGKKMPVLIQVNTTGETTKHGFSPAELSDVIAQIRQLSHLDVQGLMTMAPLVDDPEKARPAFALLRKLAEKFELPELSMGMSNDYTVAVEEGATQVRIGTALFQ